MFGNLEVLFFEQGGRVDDQNDHLRQTNGPKGVLHRHFFDIVIDFGFPAQACRVHQFDFPVFECPVHGDGVAGYSGFRPCHDAVVF